MIASKPVLRRSLSFIYGGVANTTNPANAMSRFIEPTMVKAAASAEARQTLEKLLAWHAALHERFEIASATEKQGIIREHETVTRWIASLVKPAA